ncbi:aspartyl-phosphate phosphatase Spo0E family protein [Gracilibacillus kekensis]|uniref:Spo0E like sporulation regulatory protein n=1 Tax=Gracilibacillus kekensis TaxID=1027249 RepID=A0A1M7K0J4_9BACI|nr:aspartyl-phosphate phosphatase Spo0E family protein [Gracilibacillus kekensis]SHM58830.1 Spo0E like sporulation regulatory protein [Gracilibacillus kekensis]
MHKTQRNTEYLQDRIEILREELIKIGLRDGLTAPSTVRLSELLDKEIKVYQRKILK